MRRRVAGIAGVVVVLSLVVVWLTRENDMAGEENVRVTDRVLSIGLHPSAVDYSRYPQITEAELTARIAAGEAALRDAGFDIVSCQVSADPGEAEVAVRRCAGDGPFRVAMIGAGVRMAPEHTLLFERLVNVTTAVAPGIRFCFNTSPETTIDALRRWVS
ncbi:hypothetical protein [Nocardia otitidiscaviarum]|uniref:hypothetical protein n=1 Tax=Nocardia otitidiscaviarum TaxID=1823 RepID=UPI001E4B4F2D|nr:hypothetical protein [Nocardia otitidiscaviarum]